LAGGLVLLLAVAGYFLWPTSTQLPVAGDKGFPLPPVSTSPFLNTRSGARYVGSDACRECHAGETASFRRTGMGSSTAVIDPASEPPNATFDHPLSQRRYKVERKDGKLWHREFLLDGKPDEALLAEFPLRYVIGSGHHARTYAAEPDGFLVESPLTWYASTESWGMSPGYNRADQGGFQRVINSRCLYCHAGRAEAIEGSVHRFQVHEAALSCERCHGPGSLHVALHTDKGAAEKLAGAIDDTIVNPRHLSRTLAEAVCQQCHLQSAPMVAARGRNPADFRPGLPLQDFRHDYAQESPDASMRVVGHVEQMHLSRCFQNSETLTCTSCHNPHGEPRPQERVAYYRAACLDCHPPDRCKVDAARLRRESPDNDCVHCHMPRNSTEVAHVAFTHHRIGIHHMPLSPQGPGDAAGLAELRPILDISGLGEIDRKRSLGLAYADWLELQRDLAKQQTCRTRAAALLSEVRAEGLRDPGVDVMLGRLTADAERLRPFVDPVTPENATQQLRIPALSIYGEFLANQRRYAEAVPLLRQLVRLRRVSNDWQVLAYCERILGNTQQSVEALEMAVSIDTRLGEAHQLLAPYYRQKGDVQRANWHERRVAPPTR
jgi:predicted CXXCH cytochrome family protein